MPSCYMEQFLGFIKKGFAEVTNPFSGRTSFVNLDPDNVHTIVLWSKNFRLFIKNARFFSRYNLYFLFTINDLPVFEPGIPSLDERLKQLEHLAGEFGPERIGWRFDPVIKTSKGWAQGLDSFERIAEKASREGVKRVIFSFLDMYGKVRTRNRIHNLGIIEPDNSEKLDFAFGLAEISAKTGLVPEACSEIEGIADGIKKASCINGNYLSELSGEPVSLAKDSGQRKECGCTKSCDIGSYSDMPCGNGCFYCYANPVIAGNL